MELKVILKDLRTLIMKKKNNNFKTIKMEDYLNPNIKFL